MITSAAIRYRGYLLKDHTDKAYARVDIYDTRGDFLGAESTKTDAEALVDHFVEGSVR